jgi:deoxycytidine triphosphate deaminase
VLVICVGKSTYARCGLIVNVTPLEPEWRGKVTLEISNTTPLPAKVYANEGVAQFVFLKADRGVRRELRGQGGKYQDQSGAHAAEGGLSRDGGRVRHMRVPAFESTEGFRDCHEGGHDQ